ncbi:hypothetical protein [Flavobacterium rhizosphaerae]|uniref:Anti-sigma factor n=1 Tax=Flavobacterium rhizosphaerae TaxID=3163298 RepID=A0ABW8YT78_9FLAO
MKNGENKMDEMLNNRWDVHEPPMGHHKRFMQRLDELDGKKKKKKRFLLAIPAAAVAVIVATIIFMFNPQPVSKHNVATLSPKAQQTQDYFTTVINTELKKVQQESTPETKILVEDALKRLNVLEKDYNRLLQELSTKGESKQLIHALITNLQTRISFLEEVSEKIENIKKIKEQYHENNNA